MKLTIGMIVKNEEKWLDKCLSAIKPILDNVDSELIITDTGSTDKTVEIAKKYTDKIIFFDWCNDFSAARNTAIEIASGDWFMFLDADEIFQSCKDIIDFFNSEEYRKFNSAVYTIRNFTDNEKYVDFTAPRLTKILPHTKFVKIVHEYFNTFGEPKKHLKDIAFHYGYDNNNEELLKEKFNRNYALLQKKYALEKDSNPMIFMQFFDTLALISDYKEANRYLDMGIEWCEKHNHILLIAMYCKKAKHYLYQGKNDDVLKICDKYFHISTAIRPERCSSDIEILAIKSTALYRFGDHKNVIDTLKVFFKDFEDVKNGNLNTRDRGSVMISLAADRNYTTYVGQFLLACINTGEYGLAVQYCSSLPISKYSEDRETLDQVIELETEIIEKTNVKNIDLFCSRLDDYGKERLLNKTEYIRKKAAEEMSSLSNQVKQNITVMINAGKLNEAQKVLTQYSKLIPDDPDIPELLAKINS